MEDQKSPAARRPPKSGANSNSHSMNANQILVIPDTPDRVSKQHKNIGKGPMPTYAASSSRNSGVADKSIFNKTGQLPSDSGQNRPLGNFGGVAQARIADSSVVPSSIFGNAQASRMAGGKIFKDAGRHHFNQQHKESGKVSHSRYSGIPHHHNRSSGSVWAEHGVLAKSSPMAARKEFGVQKTNQLYQPANDSRCTAEDSLKSARNENKGKAKIVYDKPINSDAHTVEGHDNIFHAASEHTVGKCLSRPLQPSRSPTTSRRVMLVRNGCISPHNTAKAKRSAESFVNDHAAAKNVLSNGSHHMIDVDEVAKETDATRAKGKGVVVHPCSPNGHKDRRDDAGCLADERGKRKFQGTDRRVEQDNTSISNNMLLGKCSSSEPVIVLNEGQFCTPSTSTKRQKKHESDSCILQKEAEVICLSSCGESSTSKSMLNHGSRPRRVMGSSILIGELSPEVRESESHGEARALQVEADEMLARELQEQLYNEILEAPSCEAISPLIREQQQQQAVNMPRASRGGRPPNATRAVPALHTRRQSQSQSLRSRLFRRGAQVRLPTSSNVARLRSRIHRHSLGRFGERNMLFPSDMDVDVRMGLLEALEAVVNDDIRMVTQLLDSDREFNENDYEMLLALDENNHQHLGASVAQIGNLPESIVQNDSSEDCSICLETPAIGDTIRHLPCLHKFHKDCIDPWLRRKRSCPVCKSDI